jgi:hypothetical protein
MMRWGRGERDKELEEKQGNISTLRLLTKFHLTAPSRIMRTVPLIFDVPLWTPREEPMKCIVG